MLYPEASVAPKAHWNESICTPAVRGLFIVNVIGELILPLCVVVNAEAQSDPEIISAVQEALHPSLLIRLPSSHCSAHSTIPFPQEAMMVAPELTRAIPPYESNIIPEYVPAESFNVPEKEDQLTIVL